ncbi:MAG: hypothetical protein RLZZ621_399 [Gemmatimonadota bacterium]
MRFIRPVTWSLALFVLVAALSVYPDLPARIPQHIDGNGRADRFVDKHLGFWLLPLLIGLGTMIALEAIRARLPRNPALFNFPGKEQLLRLPVDLQREPVQRMQWFMDLTNLLLVGVFAGVQWMLWRGAYGERSGTMSIAILVLPAGFLVVTGIYLTRIQEAVDMATKQLESRHRPRA